MLTVGLTGGIASGKSTVAQMLRDKGAEILDADEIAREVVQPGEPAWKEIIDWLGENILLENRQIDRAKLGKNVFNREGALRKLNSIIHPKVIMKMQEKLNLIKRDKKCEVIVKDVPLLIETEMHLSVDVVLLVWVPLWIQKSRLRSRDDLSEDEIHSRLSSQMPLDEKRKFADYIIDNQSSLYHTRLQVEHFWKWVFNDKSINKT